jgi:hypothetical protein
LSTAAATPKPPKTPTAKSETAPKQETLSIGRHSNGKYKAYKWQVGKLAMKPEEFDTHEAAKLFYEKKGHIIKSDANKSEKQLTFKKSDLNGKCNDCGGKLPSCGCFKALSKPQIKKSEQNNVTFKFASDWGKEEITALLKSIKRPK